MQNRALNIAVHNGSITLKSLCWPGLVLGPLRCQLSLNGQRIRLSLVYEHIQINSDSELLWRSGDHNIEMMQIIQRETESRIRFSANLVNKGQAAVFFDKVELLSTKGISGAALHLGKSSMRVRVLEQAAYAGQVRSVGQIVSGSDQRKSLAGTHGAFASSGVMLMYHPDYNTSILAGFLTFDRFAGWIRGATHAVKGRVENVLDNVDKAGKGYSFLYPPSDPVNKTQGFKEFQIYHDGGGIRIDAGETVVLESFVFETGTDPFSLLENYADRLAKQYNVKDVPKPFANWCSWYPFRLGVSEELALKVAEAARRRHLDKLGLRFIQLDLGWEKKNLPTYFEENERFPHGLSWLAKKLRALGFELGVWKGFACVSESHPLARRHPDWLVHDNKGKPIIHSKWFWEPHDRIYALDATHPKAQNWVRQGIESLARRGARYLKWDFGGILYQPGKRYNQKIGPSEGMRIISTIVRDAMNCMNENNVVLDCTGAEFANIGNFKLWYTNPDTGNTGLGYQHLRLVYSAAATHLFKQQRLALLQPSCVVMHGPGTLEEARFRATATYMMAGHVDIGDDLTTMPEDRWHVLKSILPQAEKPARPIDLFYPIRIGSRSYGALCQGKKDKKTYFDEPQGAIIWHMPVKAEWDEWQLVAVLNYFTVISTDGDIVPAQFEIPLDHIGIQWGVEYWAYEFWSGMFLGNIPVPQWPEDTYRHPGDFAKLVLDSEQKILRLAFTGPAVKLLVLRRKRPYPWPIGTTFHQSGGLDLHDVCWDSRKRMVSGVLNRSPGETGYIVIAGVRNPDSAVARVNNQLVHIVWGANNSILIPVCTRKWHTSWTLEIKNKSKNINITTGENDL